ncbi:MAG: prepilin-type N-terminal cleavage/methylation domain-containing protein [Butyrivibrio sp.]|nr:prepilin-type N-terminal cleavage/methylation domain-containing protein [Butyrivibrio sp.]
MFKKLNDLRKDKKGFTLVELIVVLVILAILMAVLIPALLGWIDKARNSQITTNANAALVAAQGLADEYYGTATTPTADGCEAYITVDKIKALTDIEETFTINLTLGSSGHDICIIQTFEYTSSSLSKTASWTIDTGTWTVN